MVTDGAPMEEEKQSQEIGERQDPGRALSSVPCRADLCYGRSVGTNLPRIRLRLSITGSSPGQLSWWLSERQLS